MDLSTIRQKQIVVNAERLRPQTYSPVFLKRFEFKSEIGNVPSS